MPAFNYSEICDLYDSYCVFDGDLPFWVEEGKRNPDVLELMAGTGRVTIPLLDAGVRVVPLEQDFGMASILATKLRPQQIAVSLVCGTALAIPTRRRFPQIFLTFQGLSELAGRPAREHLFREVSARLEPGGVFICTAHNPTARARTLDGQWRSVGTFAHGADAIEVSLRGTLDRTADIVTGDQRIAVRDTRGTLIREHTLPLRFSLPSLSEVKALGAHGSLQLTSIFGTYDRLPYDEACSPAIIAVFQKTA